MHACNHPCRENKMLQVWELAAGIPTCHDAVCVCTRVCLMAFAGRIPSMFLTCDVVTDGLKALWVSSQVVIVA